MKRDNDTIPWSAWTSLWSLDAVAVAVTWQTLTVQFILNRWATLPETFVLAATVWLIYVADRLLDASRLDLSRPHTLRHRFYHRHALAFRWAWVIVVIATAIVVVTQLPSALIRAGMLLATAILVYGAGVHFIPQRTEIHGRRSWKLAKEIQVGILFAVGVTLVGWSEIHHVSSVESLAMVTCFLSLIFSFNCRLVSNWEANLDRSQSFHRGGIGSSSCIKHWEMSLGLVALPFVLLTTGFPVSFRVALIVSSLGLFAVSRTSSLDRMNRGTAQKVEIGLSQFDRRGPLVDAVLWVPPALLILIKLLPL